MEEVIFTDSRGNQVLGTLSIPDNAKWVVIISHGFSSSKESRVYVELQSELNALGIGTLRYNYYGHGRLYCKNDKHTVSRDVTLTKCLDSLKAAVSYIRNKGDYGIGLFGSSFGGLMSLMVASQNQSIDALALKSPVTNPIDFWQQRLGDERIIKWKMNKVMYYDECGENFELNYGFWEDLLIYNTSKMARGVSCPVLIVHGGNDTVVPIKQSENLGKIIKTEVNVVKGANHNYGTIKQHDEMKKLIVGFFEKNLINKKI